MQSMETKTLQKTRLVSAIKYCNTLKLGSVESLINGQRRGSERGRLMCRHVTHFGDCLIETLMLLKNVLGELLNWLSIILGDSTNLLEVLTPFTQNKEKLENRVLSCQAFSEILRISEKV